MFIMNPHVNKLKYIGCQEEKPVCKFEIEKVNFSQLMKLRNVSYYEILKSITLKMIEYAKVDPFVRKWESITKLNIGKEREIGHQ